MHRPLFVAVGVLVLGGLAALVAASQPPAPLPPTKRRIVDRREAIVRAEADLRVLVADAKVSAAAAMVREYKRYGQKQLGEPSTRDVRVESLLEIVKDDSVEGGIREEAANAIFGEKTMSADADLETTGKGLRRQRAAFSKKVLPLLVKPGKDVEDVTVRAWADQILKGLWPGIATQKEPEINGCNPRNLPSCTQAKAAWERWLAK